MAKTGMLILTNPNKFSRVLPRIRSEVKNTLYIQVYPHKNLPYKQAINATLCHPSLYSSSIVNLYKNSIDLRKLDVRVLLSALRNPNITINTTKPVEVVYFDQGLNQDEMQGFIASHVLNKTFNCQTISLNENGNDLSDNINFDTTESYNNVVLGGTFDRLHIGHKILLSEAILRCNKKLTVGVTDIDMLKSKKLWELIEPVDSRINKLLEFLHEVEPCLEYNVVPISDVYGPTKDDPSFELLVVSAETLGGGEKINNVRNKNGLNTLKVHSVDLVPDEKLDEEEEDKVSSSNDRLRLLGTLLKKPEPKPHLSSLPYIIGLTGGIASGKTSLSERLGKLGAGVIDCDKIAHQLYAQGTNIYSKLIEVFGSDIVDKNGEINRRILGEIVFNNKEKLQMLNNLLWPSILQKTKERCQELHSSGHKIVVIEAAVLIQAGWEGHCHEVWSSIIPPEEAIRRVKNRNGLSEDKARARVGAQPTNSQLVEKSNVVLSTLWRPQYTQKQVEKAWSELQNRLS